MLISKPRTHMMCRRCLLLLRKAIEGWIRETIRKYAMTMNPISIHEDGTGLILKAEIGAAPGFKDTELGV